MAERQDHDVGKAHGIHRDAICRRVVIASIAVLPAMRSQEDRRCVAGNGDRKLELCIAIFVASSCQLSHDLVDLSRSDNLVQEAIECRSYATSHCNATPVNTMALAVLLCEVAFFRLCLLERTTDLQGVTPCFVQGARVA